MPVTSASIGAKGTDSLELIDTPAKAAGLQAAGVQFVVQYLGTATAASVGVVLQAGLASRVIAAAGAPS